MDFGQKIKALREWSGEGVANCKSALVKCDEDLLMAAAYMRYQGCLVATTNKNWEMDMARKHVGDFMLDADGKIQYKK